MAATLQQPGLVDRASRKVPTVEPVSADVENDTTAKGHSAMVVGTTVMVVSILMVLGLTMVMMLLLTDVSVLAAFGLGLYCAFWLGIGFGTIFGSAAVFGRDH